MFEVDVNNMTEWNGEGEEEGTSSFGVLLELEPHHLR